MVSTRVTMAAVGLGVVALVVGGGSVALDSTPFASDSREQTTVTVVDENGTTLATVDARVADTAQERYTGLSETESLERGEGMLFVHDEEDTHAYVMRKMDFPLDMVFVAADGTVTTVHHAPLPSQTPPDDLVRYEGRAKYVLEVPKGYTNETGITAGDSVGIEGQWG